MTVSVVTVTFNAAATVEEAVRSVVEQQGDFALDYHIVDGGSSDGTLDALAPYEDRIAQVTSEKDNGLYDAMNRGVARAKGDIISILNADDRFADPQVMADVVRVFQETDADGVYADRHTPMEIR
jgi:glycosyltransferase involved in cell wall biosynthesis